LIYTLFGEDDFSCREALRQIKQGLGDPDTLATNTSRLEGVKLGLEEFRAAAEAFPFFGQKRLVIVDGLLARFEGKKEGRPSKGKVGKDEPELYLAFAQAIKALPPSTVLVLMDGKLESRDPLKANPFLKELAGAAEVRRCEPLSPAKLQEWLRARATQGGGSLSDEAIAALTRLVGANLWVMEGELNKLILFAGGRRIEAADVEQVVTASRETSIFELVDAVMEARATQANRLLSQLWQGGASGSYVLFMLTRQLRLLVRAKDMLAGGRPEGFIQGKLGLADFALRKTLEQAGRYHFPRLRDFYHRLLETDLAIKSGRYDEELALSVLVAESCR
jgi:DNA polymerase III subunit delta